MSSDSSQTQSKALERLKLRRQQRDKLAGVVVLILSVATFISSLLMERMGTGIDRFLGAPGLTPGFLSLVLIILSLMLVVRTWGVALPWPTRGPSVDQWRMLGVLALIFIYILSLYWLPYVVSTFVMLLVFQFCYSSRPRNMRYVLLWCLVYSAVIAGALYYVFGEIFYIPLP